MAKSFRTNLTILMMLILLSFNIYAQGYDPEPSASNGCLPPKGGFTAQLSHQGCLKSPCLNSVGCAASCIVKHSGFVTTDCDSSDYQSQQQQAKPPIRGIKG